MYVCIYTHIDVYRYIYNTFIYIYIYIYMCMKANTRHPAVRGLRIVLGQAAAAGYTYIYAYIYTHDYS